MKGHCTVRTNIVFTLTGADRVGMVDEVTRLLLDCGGNIETSRMARLGGEFAILVLVSLPSEQLGALEKAVPHLVARGYKVTTTRTAQRYAEAHAGWLPFHVEVQGADHEGIIHEIAHTLSQCGITIESMDTGTGRAPNSGATLFTMTAFIAVPPNLPGRGWETTLEDAAHRLDVEIKVSAVSTAVRRPVAPSFTRHVNDGYNHRMQPEKRKGESHMPEFCSPFSGLANDRKVLEGGTDPGHTVHDRRGVRGGPVVHAACRVDDNALAIEVLKDIADEERVHAGEFLRLLHELAPDEAKFYAEGAGEVEEEIAKQRKRKRKVRQ